MNTFFQFKNFKIEQGNCAMKVSTDACIQGAWTPISQSVKKVLDIGAGTGLLSLMLAQKNQEISIDAVEIDPEAALQAKENFMASPWGQRLQVINADIKSFSPGYKYNSVICNPPFFYNSMLSPNTKRNFARHTNELNYVDLINAIDSFLSDEGCASILLPAVEHKIWEGLLQQRGWHINMQLDIKPLPLKNTNRVISICSRKATLKHHEMLCIYKEPGIYTKEFCELLKPYYLYL